ncbi:MAG: 30S ribosomal protein S9 [Candidatus Blackburnbacteria bacterium RIFCSPHIGHO2_01_FULL_43_15b]|uniref:Small ribosomal subunit protein uS9 n=1 Tax=Candidatus Blackburnbacteria bacterium RIFCSPHIGHO2_01_FULL_43_15b TaxID=1797513 RepID=A0A1G1UYV5_9BACT|nr:MAG: 30S ribosomal protein S9 [Candidatus Blackburnbacteria bacterium RIFCSPHIGHO2_01_FULL_43_15b]
MPARKKQKEYIFAVGRRKTSVARVRLHKGKDQHVVNGMPIGQYFPGEQLQKLWSKPFQLTQTEGKYFVTVKTAGGGKKGQLDAATHGIARTLALLNEETFKPLMRKNGLLTRDSRTRERRKVGTGGKARRAKQSPKR